MFHVMCEVCSVPVPVRYGVCDNGHAVQPRRNPGNQAEETLYAVNEVDETSMSGGLQDQWFVKATSEEAAIRKVQEKHGPPGGWCSYSAHRVKEVK